MWDQLDKAWGEAAQVSRPSKDEVSKHHLKPCSGSVLLEVLRPVLQVGYQPVAAAFFFYGAIIFLLILISETLGMLCSGAFRAELTGAIVLQALYVPLLMFVGFFQVCDGVSKYACSYLQDSDYSQASACFPTCLHAS